MTVSGEGIQEIHEKWKTVHQTTNTMAWLRNSQSKLKNTHLTNTLRSTQNLSFDCIAWFYLNHWSARLVYVHSRGTDSKDSSFWGQTTTGPDFYDLSSQHPPTLCEKWRQQCLSSRFALHLRYIHRSSHHHRKEHVFQCQDLNNWAHC